MTVVYAMLLVIYGIVGFIHALDTGNLFSVIGWPIDLYKFLFSKPKDDIENVVASIQSIQQTFPNYNLQQLANMQQSILQNQAQMANQQILIPSNSNIFSSTGQIGSMVIHNGGTPQQLYPYNDAGLVVAQMKVNPEFRNEILKTLATVEFDQDLKDLLKEDE